MRVCGCMPLRDVYGLADGLQKTAEHGGTLVGQPCSALIENPALLSVAERLLAQMKNHQEVVRLPSRGLVTQIYHRNSRWAEQRQPVKPQVEVFKSHSSSTACEVDEQRDSKRRLRVSMASGPAWPVKRHPEIPLWPGPSLSLKTSKEFMAGQGNLKILHFGVFDYGSAVNRFNLWKLVDCSHRPQRAPEPPPALGPARTDDKEFKCIELEYHLKRSTGEVLTSRAAARASMSSRSSSRGSSSCIPRNRHSEDKHSLYGCEWVTSNKTKTYSIQLIVLAAWGPRIICREAPNTESLEGINSGQFLTQNTNHKLTAINIHQLQRQHL